MDTLVRVLQGFLYDKGVGLFAEQQLSTVPLASTCNAKKTNAKPLEQVMADLPKERSAVNNPPFYNTGTDYLSRFLLIRDKVRRRDTVASLRAS